MRVVFVGLVLLSGANGFGQEIRGPIANPAPGVLDGVYVQEHIPTKKVIPYEFVREADVTWSKRVWRVIDLREKFNHPLYYPLDELEQPQDEIIWKKNPTRWSLWTILRHHVITGDITVYSPFSTEWAAWKDGDLFKYPLTPATVGMGPTGTFQTDSVFRNYLKEGFLGQTDYSKQLEAIKSVEYPDEDSMVNSEVQYYPRDFTWYTSKDIVQYKVKEDWFFDKERSVQDVRVLGICPVAYDIDNTTGAIKGFKELFWVYFPECRYVFQNFFVQSAHNDAQRMSFDDLFWKRMYQSYIIKESNIYDREIESYKAGIDALLEAEKIKDKIFIFEHDLWSF